MVARLVWPFALPLVLAAIIAAVIVGVGTVFLMVGPFLAVAIGVSLSIGAFVVCGLLDPSAFRGESH